MTDSNLHDDIRRYWDELVEGKSATSGELDPQFANLIRELHAQRDDVPPPDSDYASQLREDLLNQTAEAGTVVLTPPFVAPPAPNGRTQPHFWRAAVLPSIGSRAHRRWRLGRFATAAVLLASLVLGYLAFGPFRPDPDRPSPVPAAVVPAATPGTPMATATATPYSRYGHPFIGVWNWTFAPDPGCCGAATADEDGTYLIYNSVPGVGIGTWQATGERTVEISYTFQHVVSRDMFDPSQVTMGTTFQPGMEVWQVSVTIDEAGNSATLDGHYEALSSDGTSLYNSDIHWTGTRMVVDPTAVTLTPTP
jgi:hypothetical protein